MQRCWNYWFSTCIDGGLQEFLESHGSQHRSGISKMLSTQLIVDYHLNVEAFAIDEETTKRLHYQCSFEIWQFGSAGHAFLQCQQISCYPCNWVCSTGARC